MKSYEHEAATFAEAIKALASNKEALDNLESFLSQHFAKWLEFFANTPEGMAEELKQFSEFCILPF